MRDLGALLTHTLELFTAGLERQDAACVPARRYITTGQIAYDCEALCVASDHLLQGRPGSPSAAFQLATGGISTFALGLTVVLTRRVPTADRGGQAPSVDALRASGELSCADQRALYLTYFDVKDEIVGSCDDVVLTGVYVDGPQGGIRANRLVMSVQV